MAMMFDNDLIFSFGQLRSGAIYSQGGLKIHSLKLTWHTTSHLSTIIFFGSASVSLICRKPAGRGDEAILATIIIKFTP